MKPVKINSSESLSGLSITVTISDFRRLKIRLGIAKVLIKMAARVLGTNINVKNERSTH